MFKNLGIIENKNITKKIIIEIKDIKNGLNSFDGGNTQRGSNYKIYDRICNHAGGKLINIGVDDL